MSKIVAHATMTNKNILPVFWKSCDYINQLLLESFAKLNVILDDQEIIVCLVSKPILLA